MILFAPAGVFSQAIQIAMFLLVGTYATKLGKEYYHFSACGLGKVLKTEYRYKELNAFTPLYCGMLCGSDRDCKSFDYDETEGRCYLGSMKVGGNDCEQLIDDTIGGVQHYAEGPQCMDGKEAQSDKTCRCPTAYGGPGCRTRMEDCSDWTHYFEDPVVMWIWPNNTEQPFQVYCTKLSNVRTVLMNREVGDVDFRRDWEEYRDGFGNPLGDHWLGLHYMHRLTHNKRYKLRFSMKLGNESDRDAIYMTHNQAIITNESSHYTLYAGASKNVGGPVVDCIFPDLVGMPFSTRDVDNDGDDTIDCSEEFGGGWWFNGTAGCAACNPTGRMPFPSLGVRNGEVDELHWNNTVDNLASVTILMYLLPY